MRTYWAPLTVLSLSLPLSSRIHYSLFFVFIIFDYCVSTHAPIDCHLGYIYANHLSAFIELSFMKMCNDFGHEHSEQLPLSLSQQMYMDTHKRNWISLNLFHFFINFPFLVWSYCKLGTCRREDGNVSHRMRFALSLCVVREIDELQNSSVSGKRKLNFQRFKCKMRARLVCVSSVVTHPIRHILARFTTHRVSLLKLLLLVAVVVVVVLHAQIWHFQCVSATARHPTTSQHLHK